MKISAKKITAIGITAALYAALTIAFQAISYGGVQFRISEIMNLLAFINPTFAPGVVLGCFIANLFSTNGALLDCIVGTMGTIFSMIFIIKFSKNLLMAAIWPVVSCVFIGIEIIIASDLPFTIINFIITTGSVMFGEFLVMAVAYFMFRIIMKDKGIMNILKNV